MPLKQSTPPSSTRLFSFERREFAALFAGLARWITLGTWAGISSGCASALFLRALGWATEFRETHPYLLFALPLSGLAIGWVYEKYGKSVAGGSNLLIDRVHSGQVTAIPFRMAPLVLLGTVATHLFGGSAGREGTAVQMGGTLANLATRPLRLSAREHRVLIMSGISGGFGSVFGTPLAGTVFGMEVLSLGKMDYEALIPCFVAAYVGDIVCRALGIHHAIYEIGVPVPPFTLLLWLMIIAASVLFAGAAVLFSGLTDAVSHFARARIARPELRPFAGGLIVIALTFIAGTRDYLGLSLPLIARSFASGDVAPWAFAIKLLFTAVTLGTGFKGGEVTPLFCIGATLGAAFAHLTGQPVGFFAALGFVAVFAGAANTPLACTLMGIELFGGGMGVPVAAACIIAYILSGHRGIYPSQRVGTSKSHGIVVPRNARLTDFHSDVSRLRYARGISRESPNRRNP